VGVKQRGVTRNVATPSTVRIGQDTVADSDQSANDERESEEKQRQRDEQLEGDWDDEQSIL
jgi:hypothetical protein